MTANQRLSPEQQKSLKVFLKNLPNWKALFNEAITLEMLYSGLFAFSNSPFILPHEEHWCWNKSNGKTSISLDTNTEVTLQKMNARRKSDTPIPCLKIWLYQLRLLNEEPHLFAFWCEKGFDNKQQQQQQQKKSSTPNEESQYTLNLKDFSFLAPFSDPKVASEFGWID